MPNNIEALRKELHDLKNKFNKRIIDLEHRLQLAESGVAATNNKTAHATQPINPSNLTSKAKSIGQPKAGNWLEEKPSPPIIELSSSSSNPETQSNNAGREIVPQHATPISLKRVIKNIAPLFGPTAGVIKAGLDTYKHYRQEGKAPVFLLTLAGIIALVLGFSYLLQYSFNNWFNELAKVGLGFIATCCIIYAGIWINKTKKGFTEFAAALMGLGVILNYLCIYFIGSYYGFVTPGIGFVLLIINTCVAYVLASIYETRVVAVITLIGGATTPLLLNAPSFDPIIYLYYLCFLVVTILHLAEKIAWKRLTQATWVIVVAMVELVLHQSVQQPPVFSLGVPFILFYLFSYFSLFQGKQLRSTLGLEDLILISANIAFFVYSLYIINPFFIALGSLYLASAVSFFIGYAFFKNTDNKKVSGIFILTGGILLGFAILALNSVYVIGLSWAIEALFLVYFGFKFNFKEVRFEGYVILAIAIAQIMSLVFSSWVGVLPQSLDIAWGNLVSLGVILVGTYTLLDRHKSMQHKYEKWINTCSKELFSFWVVTVYIITSLILIPDYVLILGVIPMTYLLFRYHKWNLKITHYLALSHLLLLVLQVIISAIEVNSFRFSDQPLIAKIARVEFAACMWLLFEFYLRFKSTSNIYKFAQALRIAFYMLIPIIFLPYVFRNYPQFFPVVLWISTAVCYLLTKNLNYLILRKELNVLTITAVTVTIMACFLAYEDLWAVRAIEALVLGNVAYLSLLFYEKGLHKPTHKMSPYQFMFTSYFYFLGASIFIVSFIALNVLTISLLITAGYYYFLIFKNPTLLPLRRNMSLVYGVGTALILSIEFISINFNYPFDLFSTVATLLGITLLGVVIHSKYYVMEAVKIKLGGEPLHLWGFHILVTLTYTSILSKFFSDLETPAITVVFVIHATTILFITLKPRFAHLSKFMLAIYGLALFKIFYIDLSESTLIEKVIVFLVIGVLLLAGAYQFQKYRTAAVNSLNTT